MVYTNLSDVMIETHGAPSVAKFFVPLLLLVVLARWILLGAPLKGWHRPIPFILMILSIAATGLFFARDIVDTQQQLIVLIKNMLIAITVILLLNTGASLYRSKSP
jgi:hypothetical protein